MPDMKHSRTARAACQITLLVTDPGIVASARPATPISPAARRLKLAAGAIAFGLLAACGQKGPLFIPDENGNRTTATTPTLPAQPDSLNSPTRTTSQSRPTFPTLP